MINQDYSLLLEQRECRGGCGVKFRVLPASNQWYARGNCAIYCKDRIPEDLQPQPSLQPNPIFEQMESKNVRKDEQKDKPRSVTEKKPPMQSAIILEKDLIKTTTESRSSKKQKPANIRQETDVVDRIDSRFKKLWESCLDEARRLMKKKDDLKNKMDLAYLCLTDIRLHGQELRSSRVKNFAESVGLDVEEIEKLIMVRTLIWDKISDHAAIERYTFDDLFSAANHIRPDMKRDDVQKIIEDKINGKYLALIKHYDESLVNIVHFYEKFSLEFLDEKQFEKTYEVIKGLSARFKAQSDRLRNRKARVKNKSEVN